MSWFHDLNSDTQNAIKWFVAEFKYLKELRDALERIKRDTQLSDQEKDYKHVRRAWYYVRRCERRAERNIERTIEDLKQAIQHNPNLVTLEKQIDISSEKLLKAFSFYTGDFQNKLVFLALQFNIKERYFGDKANEAEANIKQTVNEIEDYLDTLLQWISGLEGSLGQIVKIAEKPAEWMQMTQRKIQLSEGMIASGKLTARADSISSLPSFFTNFCFPLNNECLYALDISELRTAPRRKLKLIAEIEARVRSRGKYLDKAYQKHLYFYKKLFSVLKDQKKALLAMGIGYSWIFGGFFIKGDDGRKVINSKVNIARKFDLDVYLKSFNYEINLVTTNNHEADELREKGILFYHFVKLNPYNVGEIFHAFDKYDFMNNPERIAEYAKYMGEEELDTERSLYMTNQYLLSKEEEQLMRILINDPSVILRYADRYLLLLSKFVIRATSQDISSDMEYIQFTYDILVLLDKSMVQQLAKELSSWGVAQLRRGDKDIFRHGVLGIVCIVNSTTLCKEIITKMLQNTESNPDLRVPVFDAYFKRVWPK